VVMIRGVDFGRLMTFGDDCKGCDDEWGVIVAVVVFSDVVVNRC